jgi:hypothetical protein
VDGRSRFAERQEQPRAEGRDQATSATAGPARNIQVVAVLSTICFRSSFSTS